ncbi:MAG: hypothetical protein AB7G10_23125 [Reyranellaceae bacterium]
MGGFFGKILTIAAVLVIAWYGWRWWQRQIEAQQRAAKSRPPPPAPAEPDARAGKPQVEDLVACRVCGAYVPAGSIHCDKRAA